MSNDQVNFNEPIKSYINEFHSYFKNIYLYKFSIIIVYFELKSSVKIK